MEKLSTSLGAHQTQHKAKLSEVERERVNEFDLQALRSGDGRRRVVVNPESVAIGKKLYHKVCVHEGRRLSPFQQWAFCAERNMSQQRRQSIATSNVKHRSWPAFLLPRWRAARFVAFRAHLVIP